VLNGRNMHIDFCEEQIQIELMIICVHVIIKLEMMLPFVSLVCMLFYTLEDCLNWRVISMNAFAYR